MKNLKKGLILVVSILTTTVFGQQFEMSLDKTFESNETKNDLYLKAKVFIAERFKSASDVIQLDDKENGMLLIKGSIKETFIFQLSSLDYYFSFTMKIYIKENKYRVVVSDVYNSLAPYKHNTLLINKYRGAFADNLTKNKYWDLMESLSKNLNSFVTSFENHMSKQPSIKEGW
jgi:hypothetical protein